jgi:hypothetical protein
MIALPLLQSYPFSIQSDNRPVVGQAVQVNPIFYNGLDLVNLTIRLIGGDKAVDRSSQEYSPINWIIPRLTVFLG